MSTTRLGLAAPPCRCSSLRRARPRPGRDDLPPAGALRPAARVPRVPARRSAARSRRARATRRARSSTSMDDLGIEDERTFDVRGHAPVQARPQAARLATRRSTTTATPRPRPRRSRYGDTRYRALRPRGRRRSRARYYIGRPTSGTSSSGRTASWACSSGPRCSTSTRARRRPTRASREADTLRAPIPVARRCRRASTPAALSLEGEICGSQLGSRGTLLRGEASVRLHISDRLAAQGGYRLPVDLDGEGRAATWSSSGSSGWQFGLELSL